MGQGVSLKTHISFCKIIISMYIFFVLDCNYHFMFQDFSNPFDLFETLFEGMGGMGGGGMGMGGRGSRNRPVEGQDEYYNLILNFKEAVFGVEKEIETTRLESCGTCNGSGAKPGTTPTKCTTCGGQGQVRLYNPSSR